MIHPPVYHNLIHKSGILFTGTQIGMLLEINNIFLYCLIYRIFESYLLFLYFIYLFCVLF